MKEIIEKIKELAGDLESSLESHQKEVREKSGLPKKFFESLELVNDFLGDLGDELGTPGHLKKDNVQAIFGGLETNMKNLARSISYEFKGIEKFRGG